MIKVATLLPQHIKKFLDDSGVGVSKLLRHLAVEYYRKSRLTEVQPDGLYLKVSTIDIETNSITVEISPEIRKALGTKIKRIAVKL